MRLGIPTEYIPACGQLALFYVYKSDINAALTAIGGTILPANNYWSSSEYTANHGWYVALRNGSVDYVNKYWYDRVRLVRDL